MIKKIKQKKEDKTEALSGEENLLCLTLLNKCGIKSGDSVLYAGNFSYKIVAGFFKKNGIFTDILTSEPQTESENTRIKHKSGDIIDSDGIYDAVVLINYCLTKSASDKILDILPKNGKIVFIDTSNFPKKSQTAKLLADSVYDLLNPNFELTSSYAQDLVFFIGIKK